MPIQDFVDGDGNFTDGFVAEAKTAAGADFAESKVFDDVPSLDTLVKNYAETKRSFGTRMDNVIQKPGADASDEDKAAYQKSLLAELGPATKPEDYEFGSKDDLPEGMTFNENLDKAWREFFHSQGWPASMVSQAGQFMRKMQMEQVEAEQVIQVQRLKDESAALDKDWPGESNIENNRLAFLAISEFGTDELKKLLITAGINDNPTDHERWFKIGFAPSQRRIWANIGKATKLTKSPGNQNGDPNTDESGGQEKSIRSFYPNSPGMKV